jgi:hypothetical protein
MLLPNHMTSHQTSASLAIWRSFGAGSWSSICEHLTLGELRFKCMLPISNLPN